MACKWFIYDCLLCKVGNSNGYATYAAAQGQATKMRDALCDVQDRARAKGLIPMNGSTWFIKYEPCSAED